MKHVDLWVTLDMGRSVDQAVVRVPRLDNWRRIMVRLRNGDAPYELPPNAMASWSLDRQGVAPNLSEIAASVSTLRIGDDTEQIIVLQWSDEWTRISGGFRAILHLIGSDGEDLWSPTFAFIVTESPYDDAVVRQSPQFTALVEARRGFDAKVEEMRQFREDVNERFDTDEAAFDAYKEAVNDRFASLDLSDDRPVDMNSGTADVRGVIRALVAYCLQHTVYPTQAEAVEAGRLRDAAAAYLSGGRWLEGAAYHVGEVVPPSPPVDPTGWEIDGTGDWIVISAVPASAINAAGDYIVIGG